MFKYDVTVLFVFCAFVYDTCKCEECPDVETMKDVDVKKVDLIVKLYFYIIFFLNINVIFGLFVCYFNCKAFRRLVFYRK